MRVFVYILVAVLAVQGKPQQRYQEDPPQPYDFQYKVENPPTKTFFGQSESGDQAGAKSGSYYVQLPDGRTLTVEYRADSQGFVPKLTYQGNANPLQG